MADNVNLTAGDGTIVAATDTIGGVAYPRAKISLGADGTVNDWVAGSGVNGVGVGRVTVATDDVAVALINTNLSTLNTSVNSVNAQLPTVLGSAASAVSLSVTNATEDTARIGAVTETAPASDTASSGLNGRLQRIAQRITSFISLFTATAAADANRLPIDERDTLVLTPAGVTSATTIFTQEMTGYNGIIVQITSAGSATITYEASDDNTTWYAYPGHDITNAVNIASATTTGLGMRAWSRKSRYFRARVSAYTSGTVTVVAHLTKADVLTYLNVFLANTSIGVVGQAAHDAPIILAPVRIAGRALTANYTAVATGDTADLVTTTTGGIVNYPWSIPDLTWQYASAADVTDTTSTEMKAAVASTRNYLTTMQVSNTDATVGTYVNILSASTVIGVVYVAPQVAATAGSNSLTIKFEPPLRSAVNEALNFQAVTTSAQLRVGAQGFASAS